MRDTIVRDTFMKKTVIKKTHPFIDTGIYKLLLDRSPVCTVDVILFNKDKTKTLLFKRTNPPIKNKYFSLGGRMHKTEDFVECAVRQVKKEIGLIIHPKKLVTGGFANEIHDKSIFKGVTYHCVDIYYGYILNDREINSIKLDSQHNDYKWFGVNDKKLHPYMKLKIDTLLKNWTGR